MANKKAPASNNGHGHGHAARLPEAIQANGGRNLSMPKAKTVIGPFVVAALDTLAQSLKEIRQCAATFNGIADRAGIVSIVRVIGVPEYQQEREWIKQVVSQSESLPLSHDARRIMAAVVRVTESLETLREHIGDMCASAMMFEAVRLLPGSTVNTGTQAVLTVRDIERAITSMTWDFRIKRNPFRRAVYESAYNKKRRKRPHKPRQRNTLFGLFPRNERKSARDGPASAPAAK